MKTDHEQIQSIAELICDLTRNCNIKEEYFAASFNLTPAELKILKLFVFSPSLTVREICSMLNLTPGRITQIVTSLEEKKLILRTVDSQDKRNISISVLPKGQPFINNLLANYNQLNQKIFKDIGPETAQEILNSLETLVRLFKTWVREDKPENLKSPQN